MGKRLEKSFFERRADVVAKDLIGKILVRKVGKKFLKGMITEAEAYFGEKDPASWARFGKRKDNFYMWGKPGTVLIKNVHKHLMLNFVTGKIGNAQAILVRAVRPINFVGRTGGPGLLTSRFLILREFNGKSIYSCKDLWIEENEEHYKIKKSGRIGVRNDLKKHLRFYVEDDEKRINKKDN